MIEKLKATDRVEEPGKVSYITYAPSAIEMMEKINEIIDYVNYLENLAKYIDIPNR